jgi:hypothetical protein
VAIRPGVPPQERGPQRLAQPPPLVVSFVQAMHVAWLMPADFGRHLSLPECRCSRLMILGGRLEGF